MRPKALIAAFATLFLAPFSSAQVISMSHEGITSGTLGGVAFPSTTFVITCLADVSNRVSFAGGYYIDHSSASIAIAGVGTYDLLLATRTFSSSAGTVGFSRAGSSGIDLFDGPPMPSLNWDMTTALSQITGTGQVQTWQAPGVNSSGGMLHLTDLYCPWKFHAALVAGPFSSSCFGDGSSTPCPCGNTGNQGAGCGNSTGSGATLAGSGTASLTNDTVQMQVSGLPAGVPGLLLRGDSNSPLPAGDGFLCISGNLQVSQVGYGAPNGVAYTHFNGATFGSVANAGAPTHFQFWYRDSASACGAGNYNFSNVLSVSYVP